MLKCQQKKLPRQGAVKVYRSGREVCTGTAAGKRQYRDRTLAMWIRQHCLCSLCGLDLHFEDATFEHSDGRGHGGGHRDDRIEKDGEPYNSAAHYLCNAKKASVRLEKFKEKAA